MLCQILESAVPELNSRAPTLPHWEEAAETLEAEELFEKQKEKLSVLQGT